MKAFLGLVLLICLFYGGYALVRLVIALIKKQDIKPWLLKLGASFVIFFIAGVSGPSGRSYVASDKQGNAVTTTSTPQKTPEELEQERKVKEEEAALQKKYDDQAKYEEWIAWQKKEKEKQAAKERADYKRNGYTMAQFNRLKTGMSYQQCVQILGNEGELSAENVNENFGLTVRMYTWSTHEPGAPVILLSFTNGRLDAKSQSGLR